jgi:hypothetical protein
MWPNPGQFGHMALGIVKMLDQVRGATPGEAARGEAERQGIHLSHLETVLRPVGPGQLDGLGAVIGADHLTVSRQETGRLEALATTYVEDGALPQTLDDRAVASGMESQQRVGRDPFHRAFTGEVLPHLLSGLGPGSHVTHQSPRRNC